MTALPGLPSTASPTLALRELATLWQQQGLPADALQRLTLTGAEPSVPSSLAIGSLLQASLGAAALAASEVGRQRGGATQAVTLDAADAVRESTCRFTLDGVAPVVWDKLSGLYRCGGEANPGWVRIHANFAHHRDGALALLGLPVGPQTEREAVAQALRGWTAEAFEDAAAARGLVVAAVRTTAQWQAHPQALALQQLPLVAVQRVAAVGDGAEAPPLPWPTAALGPGELPLRGLRVLDLTRILAGPVAARCLAAWGADVLMINSPHLPNIEAVAETSRGKLSAHIDLRTAAGRDTLRSLVREADVFLQGYRPGGLAALGFGADALARLKPGIVAVSLSAYGHTGPWSGRRGFDSLVQSATGLNIAEAQALGQAEPRALPLQALDYGAAYLLAFGALAALLRQRQQGGSWQVQVALAGVGRWLSSLGPMPGGPQAAMPGFEGAMQTTASGFGALCAVRHAVRFSHSQAGWRRPSVPPGTDAPQWPEA